MIPPLTLPRTTAFTYNERIRRDIGSMGVYEHERELNYDRAGAHPGDVSIMSSRAAGLDTPVGPAIPVWPERNIVLHAPKTTPALEKLTSAVTAADLSLVQVWGTKAEPTVFWRQSGATQGASALLAQAPPEIAAAVDASRAVLKLA